MNRIYIKQKIFLLLNSFYFITELVSSFMDISVDSSNFINSVKFSSIFELALFETWSWVLRSNPQKNKIINSLYTQPKNDIIRDIIIFIVKYATSNFPSSFLKSPWAP